MVAQRSTLITGQLKDSIGSISDATIVNLNTKKGTVSNNSGVFEIRVRLEILCDSLQYSTLQKSSTFLRLFNA